MFKVLIDDTYVNRPKRIYINFSPTIRAERNGLKIITKEVGIFLPC